MTWSVFEGQVMEPPNTTHHFLISKTDHISTHIRIRTQTQCFGSHAYYTRLLLLTTSIKEL